MLETYYHATPFENLSSIVADGKLVKLNDAPR